MRQTLLGKVISAGLMRKTVKVQVERRVMHPVVQKSIRKHKNYLVHDEEEQAKIGDQVIIEASRPLSARKRFILKDITRPVKTWTDPITGAVLS